MEDINNNGEEVDCLRELKSSVKESIDLFRFSSFIDDRFLLHFVRGKKYDSKQAFITLQNYFRMRKEKYNTLFKSLRPSQDRVFDLKILRILKNLDNLNRIVSVVDFGLWNPADVTLDEFCKAVVLFVEEAWNQVDVEKNGIVVVFDVASFGWQHFKIWTPSQVQKCINIFWNNFPIRYKAIYVVNNMTACRLAYKTIRPFLPKKIQERLYLYGSDMSCLHEKLYPNILPEFLGGTLNEEEAWDTEIVQRIRDKEQHYVQLARKL